MHFLPINLVSFRGKCCRYHRCRRPDGSWLKMCIRDRSTEVAIPQVASKGNYYGIEGIARVFGCSVPTANRIKKSGIIDKAITQIRRKIVVDADLALALAKESGGIRIKE